MHVKRSEVFEGMREPGKHSELLVSLRVGQVLQALVADFAGRFLLSVVTTRLRASNRAHGATKRFYAPQAESLAAQRQNRTLPAKNLSPAAEAHQLERKPEGEITKEPGRSRCARSACEAR